MMCLCIYLRSRADSVIWDGIGELPLNFSKLYFALMGEPYNAKDKLMNNFIARRMLSGSVLLTAIASALNSHAQSALPALPMTTQPLAPASRSVAPPPPIPRLLH